MLAFVCLLLASAFPITTSLAGVHIISMYPSESPGVGPAPVADAQRVPFFKCARCERVFLSRTSEWRHRKHGLCVGLTGDTSCADGRLRSSR